MRIMSANSKIEWTDHTFNPWIGCTKVSPGCAHCYAEGEDKRRGWTSEGWGKGKPRKRTSDSYWKQPLKWNREASCVAPGLQPPRVTVQRTTVMHGGTVSVHRPRVFCASLADWLDDEVPIEWLADLLALIHATPNLDWLLLTKRPENFEERIARARPSISFWRHGNPPENVWLGTSVEDQKRADERIPLLLSIPSKVRFLSCEPLLGPVELMPGASRMDWVIVGGESGHGARPMHPDWARSLRDQCLAAGVPFFFKQWGEFEPGTIFVHRGDHVFKGGQIMHRSGKKRTGRRLDGQDWSQFPSVPGFLVS
jgi:protein gp37